ncbi:hypothetical protein [Flavobacterium pallidum]|uniref:hypothetical protein n=1 Tax=Flavobacterium pallidum TaxID=2172098 RepID=UPI0011B1FAE4|nr:hypothetical protein [Flavobacterium pallidum]
MTLNDQQIQHLYDFTKQHYVEYYDVQSELVDHLANAIEAVMAENPTLTFDHALQAEFRKFGIFGFMDVIESRQAALTKKYHKMVWKHFVTFFKLPKIALSAMAVVLLFYVLKLILWREITSQRCFWALPLFCTSKLLQPQSGTGTRQNLKKNGFLKISSTVTGAFRRFFFFRCRPLAGCTTVRFFKAIRHCGSLRHRSSSIPCWCMWSWF